MRRDGRNSDCKWPPETEAHAATARHLSQDAEFAEDLAIRYADVHHGLRTPGYISGEDYTAHRDRCMASLFQEVAAQHNVPVERVSNSLGRNRAYIDLAINLPFAFLYCLVAFFVAKTVWRRYPPDESGWIPGVAMTSFLALAFAAGSILVGDLWARIAETYRIGNDHISCRADRLLWFRYHAWLFAAASSVFLLIAAEAPRRMRSRHSSSTDTVLPRNTAVAPFNKK